MDVNCISGCKPVEPPCRYMCTSTPIAPRGCGHAHARGPFVFHYLSGLHNSIAASVGATTTTFGLTDSVEDGWGDKP